MAPQPPQYAPLVEPVPALESCDALVYVHALQADGALVRGHVAGPHGAPQDERGRPQALVRDAAALDKGRRAGRSAANDHLHGRGFGQLLHDLPRLGVAVRLGDAVTRGHGLRRVARVPSAQRASGNDAHDHQAHLGALGVDDAGTKCIT